MVQRGRQKEKEDCMNSEHLHEQCKLFMQKCNLHEHCMNNEHFFFFSFVCVIVSVRSDITAKLETDSFDSLSTKRTGFLTGP